MADIIRNTRDDSGIGDVPFPWFEPGDSGYTWYYDPNILNILPTGRTLQAGEETGYWPVTGAGLTLELRASGSVNCTYIIDDTHDLEYNTHNLYVYTEDNYTGEQQRSVLKIVGYTGASAYSASTLLVKNPEEVQPRIYVSPLTILVNSATTSATVNVIAENCVYSGFTVTGTGGNWVPLPTPQANGTQIVFPFQVNTESRDRVATYSMNLYPVTGSQVFGAFIVLQQEAGAEPEPEDPGDISGSTDTGYTWYEDSSRLRVNPTAATLAATERATYFPVTAVSVDDLELRSSGDVQFTYTILKENVAGYNTHRLDIFTEDNTGDTRQESRLELVGYSGTSAYSFTFYLYKNSPTNAWITASPNPVVGASAEGTITTYLTLTNCTRSTDDEQTGNTQLASWVTPYFVNSTTLTFGLRANTGTTERSTYYMAYGRDSQNRLVNCRIDIRQSAESKAVTITPSRTSLSKAAGSFTCEINSTDDGTFSFSAAPWMNITSYQSSSNHGGTLYIDYTENLSQFARTGDIKVTQQISTSPYTLSAQTSVSQAISGQSAYLNVTPTAVTLTRASGHTEFLVSYSGLASTPGVTMAEGNMNIVSATFDGQYITVVYGANTSALVKNQTMYITAATLDGSIIQREVQLKQNGTGLPVAPVWRDYVLDIAAPGMAYVNYTITFNGETVYTGRAYAMPDAQGVTIFFNQLVKSYLSNAIDFDNGYQTSKNWMGNFTITSPELGNIASVAFYEDYSYENRTMQNVMSLNNPITGEVPEGGFVPFSFFVTGDTGTVTIYTNYPI